VIDTRVVKPEAKKAEPFYLTPEYRAWRAIVIKRAGGRCEEVEHGQRCRKAEPKHRMFADHVTERRDGGASYDPANGRCLCGRHHSLKTAAARAARMSR
jgi:5-methylcytosine-specific restriction protein A